MDNDWNPRRSVLDDVLTLWEKQIDLMRGIERRHFELEASEKPLFYRLFSLSTGKTVAERESFVYLNHDWSDFQKGLSESRAEVNFQRRHLALIEARYQSSYLEQKMNAANVAAPR